jgi:hypothetical protein
MVALSFFNATDAFLLYFEALMKKGILAAQSIPPAIRNAPPFRLG